MKKCPFCAEPIQDDIIKCWYCGEWLSGMTPRTAQMAKKAQKEGYESDQEAEADTNSKYEDSTKLGELSKYGSAREKDDIISPQLVSYDRVGGWLSLFCLGMVIGPIVVIVQAITTMANKNVADLLALYPNLKILLWTEHILAIGIALFGLYTAFKLYTLQKAAPKFARIYLLAMLGWGIFAIVLVEATPILKENADPNRMLPSFFRLLIAVVVWLSYFSFSKRVKGTYGG